MVAYDLFDEERALGGRMLEELCWIFAYWEQAV